MKATELMIGDWVIINNTPHQIQAIDSIDAEIQADDEAHYVGEDRYHSEDKLEGVPLTYEILEKNEWKSDNDISECLGIEVFASEKNKCCVEFDGEDEYSFNTYERWEDTDYYGAPIDWGYRYITSIYYLRYVHELQHALRLCGLDELADNFKL